jgi:hypothetical protein
MRPVALRHFLATMLAAVPLAGCPAEDDAGDDTPALGASPTKARQACEDFVDHAAAMLQRTCAPEYSLEDLKAELESGFESRFGTGCEGADGLRDEASFYADCLPGLDAMNTCPEGGEGAMPEACGDQLQFVAGR